MIVALVWEGCRQLFTDLQDERRPASLKKKSVNLNQKVHGGRACRLAL
jgi:hypothetical protein